MRKLILQMQASADGFVAATRPGPGWQVWGWGDDCTWDEALQRDFNAVFDTVDTILLSRPMAQGGYLDHWARIARDHAGEPAFRFAQRVVDVDKHVVTSRPLRSEWPRTTVGQGELAVEVQTLKRGPGRDILCFGGAGFAAAPVAQGLVDEFQFYVNPTALGEGLSVFAQAPRSVPLALASCQGYACGIVVHRYVPA